LGGCFCQLIYVLVDVMMIRLQGVLASGGEDHLVVVWNLERSAAAAAEAAAAAGAGSSKTGSSKAGSSSKDTPPEVLFKHVGHRAGVGGCSLGGGTAAAMSADLSVADASDDCMACSAM
jgi:hypothetical protein